jgi:hypothetical protein
MQKREGFALLKKEGLKSGDPIVIKLKKVPFPVPHIIVARYRGSGSQGVSIIQEASLYPSDMIFFTEMFTFYKPSFVDLISVISERDRLLLDVKKKINIIAERIDF